LHLLGLLAALLASAVSGDSAVGDPAVEGALVRQIEEAVERYNEATKYDLPKLDSDRFEELLSGEVVRLRWKQPLPGTRDDEGREKERHRVVAFHLIDEPRRNVWLSALDPHFILNEDLTEVRVTEGDSVTSTWFQFMDLPWPVRNRSWVISVEKTVAVHEATNGLAWEQKWNLAENGEQIAFDTVAKGLAPGIDVEKLEGSRYLEANTGAWTMFELGDTRTLLAYQVTVLLGGWVPDRLAAKFAMRALDDLCRTVAKNAREIPKHYDASHARAYGGDGSVIDSPELAP
jgi:hypothetical protein